ncbi:formylglycine-generating enzyme family protein [Pararhodobacter oceanensis]|uniref:Serine/threonine protein phosphatase n=1 Tax=Pararhodobacter oceanensis TaxID=2172121 RepID=A0A2T8HSS4_9RHOB|nr:formylglycine-generating enzyme family protein [Pararhodobacter oceanensis]PVH28476.1 serine/threonine protein phosphatase [Pararhodobacter oceanensis]
MDTKPCCTPEIDPMAALTARCEAALAEVTPATPEVQAELRDALVEIPGGFFDMGTRRSTYPDDGDSPRRKVHLRPYLIAPTSVTNAEFARFTTATGYRTVAEAEGWSFVFHLLLADPEAHPTSPPGLNWWRQVHGASWQHPEGPGSSITTRMDHPAVHISWFDAQAYCRWAGLILPSEAQWERAARGGLAHKKYPWGDTLLPQGQHAMNIFQGSFPQQNTAEDGYIGTAPVRAYQPNAYGLYNMTGNVWEWVSDRFGPHPAPIKGKPDREPQGAATGHARVQRGGSYLCHDSYCDRYHVHSRTRNDPESSTGNIGFRVAAPA